MEVASERFGQMHDIMAETRAYYDRRLEETTACPDEDRLQRPQSLSRGVTWRQIGELSPCETSYSLSMVQCRLAHGELMRVRNSAKTMLSRLAPGAVATRMTAVGASCWRIGGGHRARPRGRPERRGGAKRIVPDHNGRTNRLRSNIDELREAVEPDRQWFDGQFDQRTSAAEDAIEAHANWQAVVDCLLR